MYDDKELDQNPVHYDYYHVQDVSDSMTEGPEGSHKIEQPKNHRRRTGKKTSGIPRVIALAVIFGMVAGIVWNATDRVIDRMFPGQKQGQAYAMLDTTEVLNQEPASDEEKKDETVSAVSSKGAVAEVASASMPSVVAITTVSVQEIRNFFGYAQQYRSAGSGSGIIVGENEEELFIATNNHVVEGASTLSVCFIGADVVSAEQQAANSSYNDSDWDVNVDDAVSGNIKGTDAENDLAIVAVKKSEIPADTMSQIKIATLGNSDELVVGEQVVAIGNALGYGQSVTSGYISALGRQVATQDGTASELLQTDAAINPGNSGGALLNMNGEVIGINSAKYADESVEGMGYAIPISKAYPILEELMNRKTREKVSEDQAAYLGVTLADISREAMLMYNMPSGAFVIETSEGSAAAEAGIAKGDIIVKFDGQTVSGREDLIEKLGYYSAGETVEILAARAENGEYQEQTFTVTLGSRNER